MKDLNNILISAKERKAFINDSEIEKIIDVISQIDKTICLDWDKEAGEEWIRLLRQGEGLICMFHRRIGVAFVRLNASDIVIKKVLDEMFVVEIEDYSAEEWCVDLNALREFTPEISWCVSPYAVNTECMSLNDLYYATV